ncbi:NUDIX domain-containing protein [Aeromicrobium sp. Leaf350]|uniref:NUDIX domain-containing protein n=1 Tax=Aeromicrobium sp. Leaf350 TaxID=2876565 RepID=UPI001E2E6E1F|nr:NUDIX hydrolase [Aeromicrobium sp. Leaf350]
MSAHPTLPGRLAPAGLADQEAAWPVTGSETFYDTVYVSLRRDTIVDPSGGEHPRAVVQPRGAVGVLALDDDDRLLLVSQYRHAVGHRMVELPAGVLDVEGEVPQDTAARELAEEADVQAAHWEHLLVIRSSPGYTSEKLTVYRATGLSPVPQDQRTEREAEEADMEQWWLPFADAVGAVLDGRITNGLAVSAILAEHARRTR